MKRKLNELLIRPLLLFALGLTIPAFYLVLTVSGSHYDNVGRILYALAALLIALELSFQRGHFQLSWRYWSKHGLDLMIIFGALLSAWQVDSSWSQSEWLLRLAYCALIFARIVMLLAHLIAPNRLLQILMIAGCMQLLAGAGFYWLEPNVKSLADGMWLAFTTVSTVGYGDLVPSTPASRVFAIFIVLLGYALFSVVTASIAALFIGEDEKRLERELHADIRALRAEVAALREDLQKRDRV